MTRKRRTSPEVQAFVRSVSTGTAISGADRAISAAWCGRDGKGGFHRRTPRGRERHIVAQPSLRCNTTWSVRDSSWLYFGQIRDGIDLDQQTITGQPGDLHRSSRRPMIAEHARIHGAHRLKIAHADEEHTAAADVLPRGTRPFQNRLPVLQ